MAKLTIVITCTQENDTKTIVIDCTDTSKEIPFELKVDSLYEYTF